ncbi:hypothetical protein ERO13_D02G180100v2 [Gossypium hirsutum]|uniref:GPI-anchored protein LLG3 n=5 Tax=Gossypium TaxID=3633 RepID=A0A1U8JPQ0_GOSHI|nr:GPI-anchored protein LLG3-like [Gossypium hirsutum]KAB2042326.1 hypothetical protein ES319_D02G207500v1 [Gossypium barbadense]TYG80524.1 hypothetical protein ES288_D02G223100v1 [Gossypium darwinii]TYH84877.1 hypothetical protein ES332_D02G225800v1 [Gossypium tomentosum]TYI94556.1 hypothetical protein E1A91_D02G212400v1 [Gossypium mustelinum]KAG4159539.1 hypothetical protein ERO13_D02G180100v2 [Gossypium hirsutum]
MGLNSLNLSFWFLVCVFRFASASTHVSYDALVAHETTGRNLLQATKSCDEDFTKKNYTIITSRCKGPEYPKKNCCGALTDFACPFSVKVNDLNSDCARTMFSYINLYGKYPPGLFAHLCQGGQKGLSCDADPPASPATPLSTLPAFLFLTSASLTIFSLFL